jgi:hypothetical protein
VDDQTSGGPHWAAIDNHSLTTDGFPTRLVFSDYFVARSGVDGNHRMYMADVDPKNGKLTYDESWRDEVTGHLGTDFNRRDWPGNPGAGFYKPHSMVWVCPPGICPAEPSKPVTAVDPPPSDRPQTTWSGTCKMDGEVHIRDPYQLVPQVRRWFTEAHGNCTGTLNGKPYDGPASLYIDGRMGKPMACEGGVADHVPTYLYFNSSPDDVNPTVVDMYNEELFAGPTQALRFSGAYRGDAAGTFNIHGDGSEYANECAHEGVSHGTFDTTFSTVSELYG